MLLRKIQLSSLLGQKFVRLVDPKMSFTNLSILSNTIAKKMKMQCASSLSPAMSC